MTQPLISAIVPAFNAAAHIQACLRSILSQRGEFALEVICVDDGSDDDTPVLAGALAGVRVIRQPNAGPSSARNRGVAAAKGDLIAFLDADDLWPPLRLSTSLSLLQRHPEAGLAFGDCAVFETTSGPRPQPAREQAPEPKARPVPKPEPEPIWITPSFFNESGLSQRLPKNGGLMPEHYAALMRLNYIPTGAVLLRRACFEAAGGFDPQRRMVEDLDLWLRMARHCPFAVTTRICQHKRNHPGNVSANRQAMSLANLDVLGKHWRAHQGELRSLGVRMAPYFAYEYCLLGDLSRSQGRHAEAGTWYRRALRTAPSARTLYHWLRWGLLPRGSATGAGSNR